MSWGTKGECGQDSTRRRICLECAGDDIADGKRHVHRSWEARFVWASVDCGWVLVLAVVPLCTKHGPIATKQAHRARQGPWDAGTEPVLSRSLHLVASPAHDITSPPPPKPTDRPPSTSLTIALYSVHIVDDLFLAIRPPYTALPPSRRHLHPHTVAPDALFCSLCIPSKAASLPPTHPQTHTHNT
jgi:hypothetical protein